MCWSPTRRCSTSPCSGSLTRSSASRSKRWCSRGLGGAGPALEQELLGYCRERLAGYKCPQSVDFDPELPRSDTGKLFKNAPESRYWPSGAATARCFELTDRTAACSRSTAHGRRLLTVTTLPVR